MARKPYQPKVSIEDRQDQRVLVRFVFPDGRSGSVSFFYPVYPDGPGAPEVHMLGFDGGIRAILPHFTLNGDVTPG